MSKTPLSHSLKGGQAMKQINTITTTSDFDSLFKNSVDHNKNSNSWLKQTLQQRINERRKSGVGTYSNRMYNMHEAKRKLAEKKPAASSS